MYLFIFFIYCSTSKLGEYDAGSPIIPERKSESAPNPNAGNTSLDDTIAELNAKNKMSVRSALEESRLDTSSLDATQVDNISDRVSAFHMKL